MTILVSVTAPVVNSVYQTRGAAYASSASGLIPNVPVGPDLVDLLQAGCVALSSATGQDNFPGNVSIGGFLLESAMGAIVAGTTRTQAGATQLTAEVNRVDTSTAPSAGSVRGDGVKLPASAAGLTIEVHNNTANPIQVYGLGSDTINGVVATTGMTMPPNCVETFVCGVAGAWAVDAGIGFSGSLATELANDNITAFATGGQASATPLAAVINRVVTVVNANDSVQLPPSAPGLDIYVINHSTSGLPMQVFGAGSDTIDDVAATTGVSQMSGSLVLYACTTAGKWYSNGIGTGFAGQYPTVAATNNITASATQTQAGGTPVTTSIARFTTVASAGNAATLPPSQPGMQLTVINANATNAMGLFPAVGETINALAANAVYSLAATKVISLYCAAAGQWHTNPA
jgi:hypothetical protein